MAKKLRIFISIRDLPSRPLLRKEGMGAVSFMNVKGMIMWISMPA